MTNPPFAASDPGATIPGHSGIRTILLWLEEPPAAQPADEVPLLRANLKALREVGGTPLQRLNALDGLYQRSLTIIDRILPSFADVSLPIPGKSRRLVRSLLDLLQMLADDTLNLPQELAEADPRGSTSALELAFWRGIHALARQLMIGHLIASPARAGVWPQFHQAFASACMRKLHRAVPQGVSRSAEHVYHAAILLGCAQPASLTSRQVLFLADYFERFADQLEVISPSAAVIPGTFWIDRQRDAPAVSCAHKLAPPATSVDGFSCARLARLLRVQIADIERGTPAQTIGLPAYADTPTGLSVLRRLASRWTDSGKRRFQRRRQNNRTLLSSGIDQLWQLCQAGDTEVFDLSSWMITNESPDGYAVMHVGGKTGALSVGEVVAVRTGGEQNWQVCLIRWALSENPEHLELGLQILGPKAVPAIIAQPSELAGTEHLKVLVLPEIPVLRTNQLLVVSAGALPVKRKKLVLVIEQGNLVVREVKRTHLDEQTATVDILSIEPDDTPV